MTSGAFHSTKTFENLGTAANGTENIQTLLNFRNVNHSTENSRNPGSKVKWKEKIGVYLARLSSFFGNFGKYCSIRYWESWKIRTGRFDWMETPKVNWRDLSRVGLMWPFNHICAKKKERNFLKFFRCKILCLPFSEIITFYSLIQKQNKNAINCIFSTGAYSKFALKERNFKKGRERLIEVGGALFKFSFQRIVTLLWLNLSKKNKNYYCNIIHVLTLSWTFVKTWLVIKPTVVTLITHFSHRCIGTARNRLSHQ